MPSTSKSNQEEAFSRIRYIQDLPTVRKPDSPLSMSEDEHEEWRLDNGRRTVLTELEWRRGGEKVKSYLFTSSADTCRGDRVGKPDCFAATIPILPGTHHVRFLVDGIMQTSPDLPTTVDFGNNLMNYIEVGVERASSHPDS
ncbi:hypothetical protein FDECE_1612 [Fusarium decemcellulare]|nr:hypothetical protein FDECE_1612 [Fusarium decemcellulare]